MRPTPTELKRQSRPSVNAFEGFVRKRGVRGFLRLQNLVRIGDFNDPAFRRASVGSGPLISFEFVVFRHATMENHESTSVCAAASAPRENVIFAVLSGTNTMSLGPSMGSADFPDKILPRSMGVSVRAPFRSFVRMMRALPLAAVT